MTINGTAGNDTLTGTSGDDVFLVWQGGADTVSGLGGNDVFNFGERFSAADKVDGGAGSDTLDLHGVLTVTFGAQTMVNVETLKCLGGQLAGGQLPQYVLTMNDANVAAGQTLTVDARNCDALTFNGAAETDGRFIVLGFGAEHYNVTGGAGADIFQFQDCRNPYDLSGGGGNDVFDLGQDWASTDSIDGGAGNDVIRLDGPFYTQTDLSRFAIQSVETIQLAAGHSYGFSLAAAATLATPAGGLCINAAALGAGQFLSFAIANPASATITGHFFLVGGAGNDVLVGASGGDVFDVTRGGNDTVAGNGGDDLIRAGAAFTASDSVDGGSGLDTLDLAGSYTGATALTFAAATIRNVEHLVLEPGDGYALTTNDANVAAGQSLLINAVRLGAGDSLTFDGAAETDGRFVIWAGAGADDLTGGARGDVFNERGTAPSGPLHDTIRDFDFASDALSFRHVSGADPALSAGALSAASFDADLAAALAGHLGAGHAILFAPDSGDEAGNLFLIVDGNATAGYQAGADLVIHLVNPQNLADFAAGTWSVM